MRPRLAPPFVCFVDECLRRVHVPEALRVALEPDERLEMHADHFERGTPDEDWLNIVGRRRFVVFTKDGRMRSRPNERRVLIDSKVAVFTVRAEMTGPDMGRVLAGGLPSVRRVLEKFDASLVGRVETDGSVHLQIIAGENERSVVRSTPR